MKKILAAFTKITARIIGRKNVEKLLIFSAKSIDVNLHTHGLVQIGSLNGYYHQIISERFFVESLLPDLMKNEPNPVFLDIGANVGDYSLQLRKTFPSAQIYAFEPVKATFDTLAANISDARVDVYNLGFSDKTGTGEIYNTIDSTNTEVASLYPDVFPDIYKNEDKVVAVEFKMDTIDNFCDVNGIDAVDFLKIDVEGHELFVIKGAANKLADQHIKVIQFEFNSHNVYSRVFLRDFYQSLGGFEFYRLLQNGAVKLGPYNPVNEIFTLQNIIAVRNDIAHLIEHKAIGQFY